MLTAVQIITSLGVVAGLVFTGLGLSQTAASVEESRKAQRIAQDELDLSRLGQANERFVKAVEQLSSNKIEARLGGIYALEKAIKDSPEYHVTVLDVLVAYVPEHDNGVPKGNPDVFERAPSDVQAALTVLRRNPVISGGVTKPLTVHWPDVRLPAADLSGVNMSNANLADAYLNGADLEGANLNGVNLSGEAHLSSANLNGVDLREAEMSDADLSTSSLVGADLREASLSGVNLSIA
ncbi:pentapeptide repeat-containing protein [Nonomuraea sp. NPDC000554]|uniref:pentapeptide repeat-containing protein n=1 Tax=Nonomuraea sp. NPDC000554 TaxID=3154259 RepID=UPI003334838A